MSYVESFATNLSPSGHQGATNKLEFTWRGVNLAGIRYKIQLENDQGNRIWDSPITESMSILYDGPPLAPGTYQYYVSAISQYGDESLSCESFELGAPITVQKTQSSAYSKADLLVAIEDLRDVVVSKVASDVDVTAAAFTNVKDYWRTKRWADIFTAPLRVLEDNLIVLAKALDWTSLGKAADSALEGFEATYQALTTVMMLQDLQKVGEKLQYGLDGPTYISSVEAMLEAADATSEPPFGFSEKH